MDAQPVELWQIKHKTHVDCCAYSPDGSTVISGSYDKTLEMIDARTGRELWSVEHNDDVLCCSYSPDGSTVISGSRDKTLRMWVASNGKQLWSIEHDGKITCCTYSPDGSTIISGSFDKTLRMWSNPLVQWSPHNHWSRSDNIRLGVETLFMLRETGECQLSLLPNELMIEICTSI